MNCPTCAHENRPAAKFCEECAAPLKRVCASCGAELRPAAKFCDECGTPAACAAPAARPATPDGARKIVTIVFADLVGSTALHERLDPESARRFMESYYTAARDAVESHGGTVTQLLGDGVKAVFGIPRVAEDDALRAVRAAVAMQESFRALAAEQRGAVGATGLRVAVNTGEVVAKDETEIIGDPVNVAARLQERGQDGDVVVGESTHRLVETRITLELLGSFALKGRAEAVKAYRVVSLDAPAGATTAAFVGRDEELARIGAVYDAAVAQPAARLAVLLGSPGLGKSRLIGEFARRSGERATVVTAHCDAAGGATFAPLAAALRELLGLEAGAPADAVRAPIEAALAGDAAERARIGRGIAALLAGSPAAPEETFFVVRRLFAGLAVTRPVVLVIDDLQWAEPLLLDLVEHLVQWGSGVALLVLIGARPELRDVRSALVVPGGLVADVVTLGGLDAGAATRLAANVVGAADLPAAVAVKVLATSEGNPLFISELVRMLVHEGALTRDGDRWTVGTALATLEMPPTIHALLAARIERLRPEERTVLERAAVVGRHFSRSAVAELLPRNGAELDARLEALRRAELIERDTGWLFGEPVLRFHHVLIRDAAYRRILKGTRAELHARLADWIEARLGDAPEHDETIGRHLEQAHQLLGELGPLDAAGRALGERASRRLAAAGRHALARDDVPLAGGLLGRAVERLDADDPARADLALDWCEALLAAGDVGPAAAAIDELGRFARDSERLRAWHACFAGQHAVLTAPEALDTTAQAVAIAAASLAAQGDAAGEAKAHFVSALALARLGKVGACEAALDQALAAARRAGDRRRANTVLALAPLAALWGPSSVTRASGRCLDVVRVLRITQGAPAVEAVALSCQGVLEALRGRTDAARRMIASARKMVEELGITHRLLEADVFAGLVALLEGEAPVAERSLRGAYEGLRELGLGIDAARAAALLARALLAQDRAADAEALSHESEALAGDDLKAAIAWRGVRAEALARRGEHAAAVELAEKAVEIAAATDALLDHADARLALAAALRAAGRGREADAEEERAHELWETKGATLLGAPAIGTIEPHRALESHPRVQPNAATAAQARSDVALAQRDFGAVRAVFSDEYQEVDHPTGASFGPGGSVASLERLFRSRHPIYRVDPIATLGPALFLGRRRAGASGAVGRRYDVGAYEDEKLNLMEVDERGLFRRSEVFAAEHLAAAVVRLYERHAELLPDGPARERAAMTARVVAVMLTRSPVDRPQDLLAPDFEAVDHATVGSFDARGAEFAARFHDAWNELAEDRTVRVNDVLAVGPDALLRRSTMSGTVRASGGAFESSYLLLSVFGPDGRGTRIESFGVDHEAEALARLDELTAERATRAAAPRPEAAARVDEPRPARKASAVRFGNLAWRRAEHALRRWKAGDWAGIERTFAPALRFADRRRLNRLEGDRDAFLAQFRMLFDQPESGWEHTLLATRGGRLALTRVAYRAQVEGGGPLEIAPSLNVLEYDGDGQGIGLVLFDVEDEAAAWAELDARYDAGEGAQLGHNWTSLRGFVRGVARQDWGAIVALCAETVVEYDHRSLAVLGTTRGAEAWAQNFRTLAEITPDTTYRVDHFLQAAHGYYMHGGWHGAREGGRYENPLHAVLELDERGLIVRADIYDDGGIDAALARFAELTVPRAPSERFANAATRAVERGTAALAARDWEGFAALFAADFRSFDRRALVQLDSDRESWLASHRQMTTSRPACEVLATRGNRLTLVRMLWQGAGGDIGPSELDWLLIIEVNERGEHVVVVTFDPDALDAAYDELDARWEGDRDGPRGSEVAALLHPTLGGRDWDASARCYAPAFVGHDHRLVSWGTRQGPAAMVAALQAMVELAPDVRRRVDHARVSGRAVMCEAVWVGTHDGGAFESPFLAVFELDANGRALRGDFYDPHHLERARARFDEIVASERADPVSAIVRTNAAVAAIDRWKAALGIACEAGEWDAMRRICAPGMTFEDRRRLALLSGDRELMIASARERVAVGARSTLRLIGTAGDRVGVWRMLWEGGPADGRFEIEYLAVTEVDEPGLITAIVLIDLDDRRAAQREAWARWAAIDPMAAPWVALVSTLADDFNDRSLTSRMLADTLVVDDHRRTGFGRLEGGAAYVESVAVLWKLTPDTRIELGWHWAACDRHAALFTVRRTGTIVDGGAFESDYLMLLVMKDGLVARIELFELDALDTARARCAALRPDPLRIPPNSATRAFDRWYEIVQSGNLEAVEALHDPSYVVDDRRRLVRTTSGRDVESINARFILEGGWRPTRTLLATAGDRLALQRIVWTAGEAGADSEIELLEVDEVDGDGRFVRIVSFDPDDRAAANAALVERWFASGVDGVPRAAVEYLHAWNAHDLGRLRALYPAGNHFRFHDHRRTGIGLVDGDAYIASLTALRELSADVRLEMLYSVAVAAHGMVVVNRWYGTNAEGGAFESVFVALISYRDGRLLGNELFELDDLDAARVRFEELRAARTS